MKFTKPPLSQQQLVLLLQQRGLPLTDPDDLARTRWALERIGYFRLSGYMAPFQRGGGGLNAHDFRPGTTIHHLIHLHALDRDLRLHCLEGLEQIEVAMRASICDHLSRSYGAHWPLDAQPFKPGQHAGNLKALADAVEFDLDQNRPRRRQSDAHLFITRYYAKYTQPAMPPGWMVRECASFRTWAFVFEGLTSAEQKQISDTWRYPSGKRIDHAVLGQWFHSLSIMRNRCAHHARITHKRFSFAPVVPKDASVSGLFRPPATDLRTLLVVMAVLLRSVDSKSLWCRRLRHLLECQSDLDIAGAAGFAGLPGGDWRGDPLWDF